MIKKYVSKYKKDSEPVQVLKYTGDNYDEVMKFIGDSWGEIEYSPKEWFVGFEENVLEFKDETVVMYCYVNDYIVDLESNKYYSQYYPHRFYPCRKHLFELDYEPYNA